jgi:hypothetical protein
VHFILAKYVLFIWRGARCYGDLLSPLSMLKQQLNVWNFDGESQPVMGLKISGFSHFFLLPQTGISL